MPGCRRKIDSYRRIAIFINSTLNQKNSIMGKAKIKIIKDSTDGNGSITATSGTSEAGSATATSTAPNAIITLVDDKSGEEFDFETPHYMGLGFNVGDVVKYETFTNAATKTTVVVAARRFVAGTIASVTDDRNGFLTEKLTGKRIPFYQPLVRDLGITVGSEVKYDLVPQAGGGEVAVNLDSNV
jgi:hypothetical protein